MSAEELLIYILTPHRSQAFFDQSKEERIAKRRYRSEEESHRRKVLAAMEQIDRVHGMMLWREIS